jgi:hypothetical protein
MHGNMRTFYSENLKVKDYLGDTVVEGRIILK